MAYHGMLHRDAKRLANALETMDESPLGCGALAGTTHDIDRAFTAQKLGFGGVYANFLDGVSDRDYCLEVMSDLSILMMHLSRMAEELVLWSSQEFGFITLDDRYTTGSSIMPQKKNSDAAELVRGRTGRVYGNLMALLTVMKGLPLAYNKDMQEDKTLFYDSMETATACLRLTQRMVATLQAHPDAMKKAVKKGFLNATEMADYLVHQGVPFRDAHGIVGQIVLYCEEHGKAIEDLTLAELQSFSDKLGEDVYAYIDYDAILRKGNKKEMLNV
jgi:argininosuccinate lyase